MNSINEIFDKEDRELLRKDFSRKIKCIVCGKLFISEYPKSRRVCEPCFEKETGYKYPL